MMEKLKQTKALPVSLLVDDRPCLVVGGGKIALRKTGHLLDAGAAVTVVCPDLCEAFDGKPVQHIARKFEVSDIEGMSLVFAATSDRHVNRQVLEACREKNILCSCVDGNWAQSDFTTPAIARHGNLTLTVSTGGQSCRQAKLVKDNLSKHLEMIDTVELVVVGTDHRHLSIDEREPFHLTGHRLQRTGFMLMQLWGVHEFMILNTCNRVEIIAVVSRETARNGILRHLLGFDKLNENQFYIYRGEDAFEHLGLVAAGMLSQTPGESHVSAQLKQALADAQQAGWAGSMMQEWVSSFLHVSKHIQTEVAPLLRGEEIEELALKYLDAHRPDLSTQTLLVLGAGIIGQGLVRDAVPKVGKIIWCYHKNKPEQAEPAPNNLELFTFNDIKDRIGEADIIISATEAPGHILHSGHAPFFDQEKELTLIDLGMPRNIDPALRDLSSEISLIDLDGLKHWHRQETAELEEIFIRCRKLIGEHQEQYERIINSFQGGNAQ
jgi:glutamyl-tRNA reductase